MSRVDEPGRYFRPDVRAWPTHRSKRRAQARQRRAIGRADPTLIDDFAVGRKVVDTEERP